jgi:hypothetical protein
MQLKASHLSNILLVPTLDIEIVWQTHLLRPEMYQKDCFRLFGRIIDHSLLIPNIEYVLKEQAFQDTCQLYKQRFNEQYCSLLCTIDKKKIVSNFPPNSNYSYWDKSYFNFSSESPKDYENPFSFTEGDLIMDSKWLDLCKKFMSDALNKAPLENYHRTTARGINLETGAIKRLEKSYERFLYMAAKISIERWQWFYTSNICSKHS